MTMSRGSGRERRQHRPSTCCSVLEIPYRSYGLLQFDFFEREPMIYADFSVTKNTFIEQRQHNPANVDGNCLIVNCVILCIFIRKIDTAFFVSTVEKYLIGFSD